MMNYNNESLGLNRFSGDTKLTSKICVKIQGSNKFALGVNGFNIPFAIVEIGLEPIEKTSLLATPVVQLQRATTKSSLISVNKAPFINTTSIEQFGSFTHKANITISNKNLTGTIYGPLKGECNIAQELFSHKLRNNSSIRSVWDATRSLVETHEGSEGR